MFKWLTINPVEAERKQPLVRDNSYFPADRHQYLYGYDRYHD